MTRDEHIAAAERWLAQAETMFDNDADDGADVAAAGIIAVAHFLGAWGAPVTVAEQRVTWTPKPHPSSPAGQGHDGQETAR